MTIVTDASTDFHKGKCGDLEEGTSVSGEGVLQSGGVVRATKIDVDKKKHD